MQRTVIGPFDVRELGSGGWQLSAPGSCELIIRGAPPDAAAALRGAVIRAVEIEWRGAGVRLGLSSSHGMRRMEARTAVVHESLPRLYESLPLVGFDERARRFWRRVFRLVRIPGGRALLRLIARRAGSPK